MTNGQNDLSTQPDDSATPSSKFDIIGSITSQIGGLNVTTIALAVVVLFILKFVVKAI